jgi:hypothetical protein
MSRSVGSNDLSCCYSHDRAFCREGSHRVDAVRIGPHVLWTKPRSSGEKSVLIKMRTLLLIVAQLLGKGTLFHYFEQKIFRSTPTDLHWL